MSYSSTEKPHEALQPHELSYGFGPCSSTAASVISAIISLIVSAILYAFKHK